MPAVPAGPGDTHVNAPPAPLAALHLARQMPGISARLQPLFSDRHQAGLIAEHAKAVELPFDMWRAAAGLAEHARTFESLIQKAGRVDLYHQYGSHYMWSVLLLLDVLIRWLHGDISWATGETTTSAVEDSYSYLRFTDGTPAAWIERPARLAQRVARGGFAGLTSKQQLWVCLVFCLFASIGIAEGLPPDLQSLADGPGTWVCLAIALAAALQADAE
jgi:hypothetical protein